MEHTPFSHQMVLNIGGYRLTARICQNEFICGGRAVHDSFVKSHRDQGQQFQPG